MAAARKMTLKASELEREGTAGGKTGGPTPEGQSGLTCDVVVRRSQQASVKVRPRALACIRCAQAQVSFGVLPVYILLTMSRAEITTPDLIADESVVELSLRPQRLEEFIGQEKVKANLQLAIDAALARGEPLDHAVFYGPPGLGKTTLAELIARELRVNIRTTSGPALEKPGDLVGTLTNMRAGDILFIDEIHRLRPVIEEFLYPAMEDYRIDIRLSEGPKAQTITMPIEQFTLIGATTRFGMLTAPMRARFGIEQRLNYYSAEDLELIVRRTAEVLKVGIDDGGAMELAKRSRGTPRVANRLLRRVRDYAQVRADGVIT